MPSPNPSFTEDTSLIGVGYSSVASADYDNDSKLDLLLIGRDQNGQPTTKLYRNTGSGFSEETSVTLPGLFNGSVAWTDYNSDGKLDLVLTGQGAANTRLTKLYRNTGSGFSEETSVTLPNISGGAIAAADYDNDGKSDLLLTGFDASSSRIAKLHHNTGSGFSEATSVTLPGVSDSTLTWADYNGDGKLDLLLTGMGAAPLTKLYRNTGSGFVEETSVLLPGVRYGAVAWADYNSDGKLDLLLTGQTADKQPIAKLYRNTGTGFSEETAVVLTGVYHGAVAWADYNSDGKLDLLLTGLSATGTPVTKLYKNSGTGFQEDFSVNLPGVSFGAVAWANYTEDDKPDLLLSGITVTGEAITQLYKNTFTPPVQVTLTSEAAAVVNQPFTATARFSRPVTGLTEESLEITNGTVSNLETSDNQTYSFTVTPADQDEVVVAVPASVVGNVASVQLIRLYDSLPPAVPAFDSSPDLTRDNQLLLTGTAEVNSTVTVFLEDGTEVGRTTADAVGLWQLTPTALPDGFHNLTATATDAAGNTSEPSVGYGLTVDTQAPAAPLIEVLPPSANAKPTLVGTAEANSTIQIQLNDDLLGTVTADASGNWQYSPTSDLPDGRHSLSVTATDAAGNKSAVRSETLVIDTQAPAAPTVTGTVANGGSSNGARLALSGTTDPGSTIQISDADRLLGETIADSNGEWHFSFEQNPLLDGEYILTAVVIDSAGNRSEPSQGFAVVIDSELPVIALDSAAAEVVSGLFSVDLVLEGTAAGFEAGDAPDSITVTNGSLSNFRAISSSQYQFDVTPIQEGLVTVAVTQDAIQDAAQNGNSAVQLSRSYDATPPAQPRIATPSGATSDPKPVLSGSAEANVLVQLFQNGQPVGSVLADQTGAWQFPVLTDLLDGSYEFTVAAIDPAGNVSAPSSPLKLVVDTIVPEAPRPVALRITNSRQPILTGTALANSRVQVKAGGRILGETTATDQGQWQLTAALPDGIHSITATVSNQAGTLSAASTAFNLLVDSTAPTGQMTGVNGPSCSTPVDQLSFSFSEAISGFKLSDLQLLRNSSPVDLSSASLSTEDQQVFVLSGLTDLTAAVGNYRLLLAPTAEILDAAQNRLAEAKELQWSVQLPPAEPPVPALPPAAPTETGRPSTLLLFDPTTGQFTLTADLVQLSDAQLSGLASFKSKPGTAKPNSLKGTRGSDLLQGYGNRDRLIGGKGADILSGGSSNDLLEGEAGNDLLLGGAGNDELLGGEGGDILIGEAGKNLCTGSQGKDSFVIRRPGEHSTITDFSQGDQIVLLGSGFEDLTTGSTSHLRLGRTAKAASDRLLYSRDRGELLFDIDGRGGQSAIEIAQLKPGTALSMQAIQMI